jgi:alpha-tubulin suppressor-like RCC1 family protein
MRGCRLPFAAVALIAVASCGDDRTSPAAPSSMEPVGALAEAAPVASILDISVGVKGTDGRPMSDVLVTWSTDVPTSSLSPVESYTDSWGIAETQWTLGTVVGEQTARATVAGLNPISFSLRGTPGPAAVVTVDPRTLTLIVGEAQQITVTITDEYGNQIEQPEIVWASTDDGTASVDVVGMIRAHHSGEVSIAAHIGQVYGTAELTVNPLVFVQIDGGAEHTCAVSETGRTYCWGSNGSGQLAFGPTTVACRPAYSDAVTLNCSTLPVPAADSRRFKSVVAAGAFSCGLDLNGIAYCWGDNRYGQLGNGTWTSSTTPVLVSGGLTFEFLHGTNQHVCGVTADGSGYCWGRNYEGSLGDGSTEPRNVPTRVAGSLAFTVVETGGESTCAIATDGTAYCWGYNSRGQLGIGDSPMRSLVPAPVAGDLTFISVAVGVFHACGITVDGSAYCWGEGQSGELGTGGTERHSTPVRVAGDIEFRAVTANGATTCGLATTNVAHCWGWNYFGQTGTGSGAETVLVPSPVVGEFVFGMIDLGHLHACGVDHKGRAYCWGANNAGQLGDGTTSHRGTPSGVSAPGVFVEPY